MRITERYTTQAEQSNLSVVEAHYIGDFAIRLTFTDGYMKLVDFKPFLEQAKHPSIKRYLNENQFKKFQIKDGNLDWNDFEMSFPVIDLYQNAILKDRTTHIVP